MIKMRKVGGETYNEMYPETATKTRILPSFSMDEEDLPEIKSWQIGKKYVIQMEVEMVSASKNEFGRKKMDARFNIHKIGVEEEDEQTMMAKKGHY